MLGKLLKYEVKATFMIFMMMYLAILGLSIFNRLFNSFEFEWGIVTTTCILVALFVALGVITIIMAVQRFNKNLLGHEGYLMFTLPVNSKQMVISKLLVTLMWTIISGIVAILSFVILFSAYIDWYSISEAFSRFQMSFSILNRELVENQHITMGGFIGVISISILVSYIEFILVVYASLVIAQLPIFSKHRGLSAFGAFFVLNIVVNNIFTAILAKIVIANQLSIYVIMLSGIIFTVLVSIGLFIGINVILSKHLNLE